ncbi:hypothetical protein ARMGADRAFT_947656, partial [Armillaria gallica]
IQPTGKMQKHIYLCWGPEVLDLADNMDDLEGAQKVVKAHSKSGTITLIFEWLKGKGKVTYSHCTHTKTETHLCPFNIIKDCGFNCLMKTGWPSYYLPHPTTISCDIKTQHAYNRRSILTCHQEYDGDLSFATDAWTSPNYQAFVAFTIYFIYNRQPVRVLLDFLKVSKVF